MRSIFHRVLASGALVVASLQGIPASAAEFLYTVTGVTTADVFGGLYGGADPTLPAGLSFTATFRLNDALPTAFYTGDASQSTASGGGELQDGSRPPVFATILIGAYSHTVRQGNFFQPYLFDPSSGDAFGTEIRELDFGAVNKDLTAGSLDLISRFNRTETCCGVFFGGNSSSVDDFQMFLRSPGFSSGNFRETGTFALGPQSTGSFIVGTVSLFHSGDVSVSYEAAVGLMATQLTVTAVPTPASWALMISGVALLGGMLRRQRRRSVWTMQLSRYPGHLDQI